MTGVARAPVKSAAVSSHSAVLSETFSTRAIVGMSGAPKLLTMATSAATKTSVGTRAFSRQGWGSTSGVFPPVGVGVIDVVLAGTYHQLMSLIDDCLAQDVRSRPFRI